MWTTSDCRQLEALAAGLLDDGLEDEPDEPLVDELDDEPESADLVVVDSLAAGFDSDEDVEESDLSLATAGTAPERESVR